VTLFPGRAEFLDYQTHRPIAQMNLDMQLLFVNTFNTFNLPPCRELAEPLRTWWPALHWHHKPFTLRSIN
jgi:hypothetical protein